MEPNQMLPLSVVMEKVKNKGYGAELVWKDGTMQNEQLGKTYQAEELEIVKTFRFEGDSNPSDNAVLFLVEDQANNKAFLLDSYGMYSKEEDEGFDEFLKKIPTTNQLENESFE